MNHLQLIVAYYTLLSHAEIVAMPEEDLKYILEKLLD